MKKTFKMTNMKLRLFALLSISIVWFATLCPAQDEELETFNLEVISLINDAPIELYYRTSEGEYERLKITSKKRGVHNPVQRISPLALYRKTMVDGEETMVQAMSIPLPVEDEQAMLFYYLSSEGKAQYHLMEDSPGKHAGGTVRIVNLTNQDIACLVDSKRIAIKPFSESIENVSTNQSRIAFAFALLEPKPYKSPSKILPMRGANKRLLIVFSSHKRQIQAEDSDELVTVIVPDASRMYDRVNQRSFANQ